MKKKLTKTDIDKLLKTMVILIIEGGLLMPNKKRKSLIGESFTNIFGEKFTIVEYNNRILRTVMFDNGNKQLENIKFMKDGCKQIFDKKNTPTVFNLGIPDIEKANNHHLYNRWIHMIGGCYSKNHPKYKSYGEKGVVVEEYLLRFSNYIEFISSLPNYEKLLKDPNNYQVDKDIKSGRMNIYSREAISIVKFSDNLNEENKLKKIKTYQYNLEDTFINTFGSITKAEQITRIHRGNIARCIRGGSKAAGGYKWTSTLIHK